MFVDAIFIICYILNFFPGGSILLAANNWPNKIKAYMAILHEDWQKRGLKPEEGIIELLGREMKSETLAPGLFEGVNIDNQPNEGFAIANIEEFYKGLGFTEEIEGTIKETIEGFFKGSSSLVKIELSEIKKYKGNYGLICELLDTINTEYCVGYTFLEDRFHSANKPVNVIAFKPFSKSHNAFSDKNLIPISLENILKIYILNHD